MTIWDDICAEQQEMPKGLDTEEDVLCAVQMGITLFPVIGVAGLAARREFFVKLAATIVHGIELMDVEIEAIIATIHEREDTG